MEHSPHGRIDSWAEDHLVFAAYEGQINLEGMIIGLNGLRKVIEALNGAPFTMLIDVLEVEGGTPEAYEELNRFNQWINTQPLVAKATIISSKLQLKLIDSLLEARKQQNQRSFADKAEALAWLHSEYATKAK